MTAPLLQTARRRSRRLDWFAVFLCASVVLFTRVWEGDLHGDPVHYAAAAKTMVSTGQWLVPQDEPGRPYLRKPPLMLWLTAVNFRLFGADTYTAKFWSCAFGVGVALITFLLGRRLFGPVAGLLAGGMVAATPGFVMSATNLRFESAVTFYAVLAVYALVRAHQDDRPRWLLVVGLAAGLGAMTKAVSLVHVGVLALGFLALCRPRWLFHPCWLGALAVAALLAVPWHWYIAARLGDGFAREYVGKEIQSRLTLGLYLFGNLWKNLSVLLVRAFPWWPFAVVAVHRRRTAGKTERWGLWIAGLWIAEVIVLMAVPAKRYDRYMVPAYPAVALGAGYGLSLLLKPGVREKLAAWMIRLAVISGLTLALVPVKLHSYRCRGFTHARAVLDQAVPGRTLAWYGAAGERPSWGVRSKSVYYLDRTLTVVADPTTPGEDGVRFVVARDRHAAALSAGGFEKLLALDDKWTLFHRPR